MWTPLYSGTHFNIKAPLKCGHLYIKDTFVGTQFNIKAPLKYGYLYIQDTFVGTQFNIKAPLKCVTPLYSGRTGPNSILKHP